MGVEEAPISDYNVNTSGLAAKRLSPGQAQRRFGRTTAVSTVFLLLLAAVVGIRRGPAPPALRAPRGITPHYSVTELEMPGWKEGSARAINDRGEVVGEADSSSLAHYPNRAWLWRNGKAHDLGPGFASAINNKGQVIGEEWKNGSHQGWLSDHGRRVSFPGSIVGSALNDHGQVAGSNDNSEAAIWQNHRVLNIIASTHAWMSDAQAINNRGQVVGMSTVMTDRLFSAPTDSSTKAEQARELQTIRRREALQYGFLWEHGRLQVIPSLTAGIAINDGGQILGEYVTNWTARPHPDHGYLLDKGRLTDLGRLRKDDDCSPGTMNNSAQIAGESGTRERGWRAFLWQRGRMVDLNSLIPGNTGWLLAKANGINDSGWMVGDGKYHGEERGFLLRPVYGD